MLIVDADTIFLNKVEFIDKEGGPLFNPGRENEKVYFDYGARLIPNFMKSLENIQEFPIIC